MGWWSSQHLGIVPLASSIPSPCCGPHASMSSDPRACLPVGWMEQDPGRAWALLEGFANVTEPFKVSLAPAGPPCSPRPALPDRLAPLQVWTENADGVRCCELPDRHGGFLQAVLFGVTGFRWSQRQQRAVACCPCPLTGLPFPQGSPGPVWLSTPCVRWGSLGVHLWHLLPGGAGLTSPSLRAS